MRVLIRSDGGKGIGMGHIKRDLVFAKELKTNDIYWASLNPSISVAKEIPYPVYALNTNGVKELSKLVKKLDIDLIAIDHYGIDHKFEKRLKTLNPKLKILSFDDTYKKHHCDILLNHNIYADKKRYENKVPTNCELRCGARYTLIRDEFKKERDKKRKKEGVFVSLGASDIDNKTLEVIKTLKKELLVKVVTTSSNPNISSLKQYAKKHSNIKLYIDTKNFAKLLNSSKYAVITPGVTAHESLYLGVPFKAVQTAKNQRYMYKYLKQKGLCDV